MLITQFLSRPSAVSTQYRGQDMMCISCSTCLLASTDDPSTDIAAAGAHAPWHAQGQHSVPNSLLTGLHGLRSTQDECDACSQV